MPKLVLTLSSIIIIISIKCATFTNGVTIDNTLVTSRHDCFERIAIGAMLPFEKTFRTSETNSVKVCQELCEREGDQCQTFSLGITVRGNGTCQLSSEVIDTTHARPVGTIFDPDFDLYARRNDCVTDPNTTPFSGNNVAPGFGLPQGFESTPTFPASPPSAFSDEPSSIPSSPLPPSLPPTTTTIYTQPQPSTTNENPMFPSSSSTTMDLETSQPTQFIDRPSTTPENVGTTRYEDRFPTTYRRPSPPITPETTEKNSPYPPTTMGGSDRDPPSTMGGSDRYPPTTNQDSTNQYGSGERYPLKDRYPEPYPERETTRPASYPMYGDDRDKTQDRPVAYPLYGDRDPPVRPNSRPNYNEYPNYDYPMLYEKNYPMPNEQNGQYPNLYAQNVPPLKVDYYRPSRPETSYDYNDRNNYYNNVDRYGLRPSTIGTGGGGSSSTGSSSSSSSSGGGGNGYDNRPIQTHQNPDRPDPTHPSNINTQDGYNTRPTSSSSSSGGGGSTNGYDTQRPDSGYRGPNYHITDAPIEVYFNPESYYNIKPQSSGGGNIGGTINNGGSGGGVPHNEYRPNTGGGGGGGGSGGYRPPATVVEACFRRVLAGKRISPQFVRRTLSCERIEDCQRECGEEKRFTCEGFNYRIDTTGNGQGLCELIEVPLSEMDLYSSPHNRDANLLRHPDYDYYERDRNASPGCSRPPTGCVDCAYLKPYRPYRPVAPLPPIGTSDHYRPIYQERQPQPEYNYRPQTTAIDKYRPPYYEQRPSPVSSQSGYSTFDYHNSQFYQSGSKYGSQRPTYPSDLDRYDPHRPDYRPGQGEIQIAGGAYGGGNSNSYLPRPDYNYRPANNYQDRDRDRDRDRIGSYQRPSQRPYVPYSINQQDSWGVYGGNYGGGGYSTSNANTNYGSKVGQDYWGIRNPLKRVDGANQFNYSDLGKNRYSQETDNNVWNYPGSRYNNDDKRKVNYGSLWTRRPGPDECSVKSSEGFRLHKGVIRHVYNAPTIRECEQMCNNEAKFKCQTYSYRYTAPHENCLLCDRPYSLLDYYTDLEPDRDYDVYSMSDDKKICNVSPKLDRTNGPQCFFRAIDTNRFFKSIIRDSLNVRSIGECEMECIKTNKFTCRAFSFRYGSVTPGSPIADNCQLSDWPVKDMDKDRHLIYDNAFDVFERASYGHGCEIRPIIDTKHQKLCYLGYGSPARLLSSAIKKVISVPTELDCKTECTRYRENTLFKCFAFSFGSHKSSYNCEMSDLDQSELKLDIHYAHSHDRDYWLFAWNPFDWTCRDRVTTIGGGGGAGNRVNNDRRLDIFRDPGEQQTWRHFTVSGKPCRKGTQCDRNLISGFYSCELEGGEIGAWDYCCRDDHPCGYTQGFDYPWCFVGDGRDQWRKCSDHYFPPNDYLLTSGSNKIPTKTPTIQTNIQQRPPRPGGLSSVTEDKKGRIWPITYLYIDGPPNSTELSNAIDCKKEIC